MYLCYFFLLIYFRNIFSIFPYFYFVILLTIIDILLPFKQFLFFVILHKIFLYKTNSSVLLYNPVYNLIFSKQNGTRLSFLSKYIRYAANICPVLHDIQLVARMPEVFFKYRLRSIPLKTRKICNLQKFLWFCTNSSLFFYHKQV